MSDGYKKRSRHTGSNKHSHGGTPYSHKKQGKAGGTKSLKTITLPYDFISLPGIDDKPEYYYPYHRTDVNKMPPRHDLCEAGHVSGYISYQITPYSPLALELRNTSETDGHKEYWMSGSQIRGKLRANVEVLSASYPEFVDKSELLYRKIMNGDRYKQQMGITDQIGLEQAVKAGYLYRDHEGKFYIIPAVLIGDKHFASVKELDIVNWDNGVLPEENRLFKWNSMLSGKPVKQVMKNFNDQVRALDNDIRECRRELGIKQGDPIAEAIESVFTKDFAFTKVRSRMRDGLQNLTSELNSKLRVQVSRYNTKQELEGLLEKYIKRWVLKAEMDKIYGKGNIKRNLIPYEKEVKYILSGNSVIRIENASSQTPGGLVGVLFNSTNANSKRSHYLVGKAQEDALRIHVPDSIKISYNRAYDKIRLQSDDNDEALKHYNLFKDKGIADYNKPKVVFYQTRSEEQGGKTTEVLVAVGRTPYFKVPYDHQLGKLLGEKDAEGIDYASAMFGYISSESKAENNDEAEAYKSRLRFSPVRVRGEIHREEQEFLLATPQASAGAMYLKPKGMKIPTYEGPVQDNKGNPIKQEPAPRLRGTKYYHVLSKPISTVPEDFEGNMKSKRYVYDSSKMPFHLEGKIHFKNLTKAELGLLLLAMDINLLPDSNSYNPKGKPYYELIGGAKAYGYGKVQFKMTEIMLEQQGNSFESLVMEPFKAVEDDASIYVSAYLEALKHNGWFKRIDIKRYVQSKLEKVFGEGANAKHVDWSIMNTVREQEDSKKSGGGYPDTWILE